jgi:hypothetical protein
MKHGSIVMKPKLNSNNHSGNLLPHYKCPLSKKAYQMCGKTDVKLIVLFDYMGAGHHTYALQGQTIN